MNITLEPHQLVAHWIPGFILLLLATFICPGSYAKISHWLPQDTLSKGFIWVVLPFVSGQLIDALRNSLIEEALDKCCKKWWPDREVNWPFFFSGDKEDVEKLRRSFFDYYVFDANLAFPALCFTIWRLWLGSLGLAVAGFAVTALLIWDARSLRKEIAEHTNKTRGTQGDQSA